VHRVLRVLRGYILLRLTDFLVIILLGFFQLFRFQLFRLLLLWSRPNLFSERELWSLDVRIEADAVALEVVEDGTRLVSLATYQKIIW
jgi:hypothetical protein